MLRKQMIVTCVALTFSSFAASETLAARRHLLSAADAQVAQLVRLMDKNKNGQVSKAEFLQFASEEFTRIDADRSGGLNRKEFSRSHLARGRQSAEYSNVAQLVAMMDRDRNGVVSKEEFVAFMSVEFDRIDVDRSGALTRQELSTSVFVRPRQSHPGGVGR